MEANYGVYDCGRYNIILYVQEKRLSKLSLYTNFSSGMFQETTTNIFFTVLVISAKKCMCIADILQYYTGKNAIGRN